MFCGERLLSSLVREGDGCRGHGDGTPCEGRSEALQMSRQDNAAVVLLHPSKEEHKHERKWGLCAFNEIVFVYKEDFSCCEADGRRFWLCWNVWYCLRSEACVGHEQNTLLCNISCLVKINSAKSYLNYRKTNYRKKLTLPFCSFLSPRRKRTAHTVGHEPRQLKGSVRAQQVSESSNNHKKLLFQRRVNREQL